MTPAPVAAAPSPVGVIETDAFCEHCGFNLHTQPVWRDERLGVLVCRCPECGGHQSAQQRSTAAMPWLHRLAILGAMLWVGLALAFVAATGLGLFISDVASVKTLSYSRLTAVDGTLVTLLPQADGTMRFGPADQASKPGTNTQTIDPSLVTMQSELQPWLGGPPIEMNSYDRYRYLSPLLALFSAVCFGVPTFAAACLLSAGSWFWRVGRRWAWMSLPVLAAAACAAIAIAAERQEQTYMIGQTMVSVPVGDRHQFAVLVAVLAAQLVVFAAGIRFGRPIARGVLLIFAPPRVRQLFAFLWHCDGKQMPPARPVTSTR